MPLISSFAALVPQTIPHPWSHNCDSSYQSPAAPPTLPSTHAPSQKPLPAETQAYLSTPLCMYRTPRPSQHGGSTA
ncbi:hypothetical protein K505DRAFT_324001 [Melanomma pulvis-pyrius CBS 109.77]|uniref:Uncharacterized protein n=1 Tax=Melanomma pulvis-pyrius CBS 109.77 TaxID=1314802 RepID=A0A6A6XH79_9PLEO|nr:hypothetical protein K505DRAFT_324001 [Melanomma pulvis-pyrius CBS 109.77]